MVSPSRLSVATVFAAGMAFSSAGAFASMGNTATTFGILPTDIASAQGLSLFNSQVSATYYNPAFLVRDPRGELTVGLFHAEHELRVDSQGGLNAPTREGDVLNDTPSQQVLIGMKTDLSSVTKYNTPFYLGFMAGVEKFGQEMLSFQSGESEEGQFLNYDRQPLFLNIGGGLTLWRGIDVGASVRVTLHAEAALNTDTTLGGTTSRERLEVSAKPVLRPILGVNVNWGETFCSHTPCWMENLDTALVYKGYSNTRTSVDANAIIPETLGGDGLLLAIRTIDSFQPEIVTAGAQYQFGRARVALSGEFQRWSRLEREFEGDTIKSRANIEFRDIFIPRIGAEYRVNDMLSVSTGLAYEVSPLKSTRTENINYLDNDRIIVGFGGALEIANPPVLAFPLRLDFGYQYHHLRDRDFIISGTRSSDGEPFEELVTADGDVHVVAGSITIKF